MEPVTTIASFATIVGLLAAWKAERRDEQAQTREQFIEWLQNHRHEQIANLILTNVELSQSIEGLLQDQHGELMAKLRELDATLSAVASHLQDFAPMARATGAEPRRLPAQAVSILRQMNDAGAISCLGGLSEEGRFYCFLEGASGMLQIEDQRFIEDDFETLCNFGLLSMRFNGDGDPIYRITRAGAAVGDAKSDA